VTKRAVLVGCGAMAKGWLKALAEAPALIGRVEVVGLVDVNAAAAEGLRDAFALTGAKTGSDLNAMLAATQPDLLFDVVVPSARRDVVLAGLRHGCHVLTEKPMAASLAEAEEIVVAAKTAGRVHAVVQNRRFIDGVRRIRQLLDGGALGELTALHADFFIGAHFGGFREQMDNVLLLDMAIHTLDAARFMAAADPVAVYCHETNPRGSWYQHGAAANAIFEFSNDIVFTYRGSWAAEGANTSWESAWRIIGTKGTLLRDGGENFEAHQVAGAEGFFRPLEAVAVPGVNDETQIHGHASVIADFLDAIDSGRAPETAGSDNIKSLAMVFGAIDSARTKQRVPIKIQETL
jgi:predicted dehydrogenase